MADNRVQIIINADGSKARSELGKVNEELDRTGSSAHTAGANMDSFGSALSGAGSLAGAFGVALTGVAMTQFAKDVFETGAKMQSLSLAFKSISGTSAASAAELEFVRQTAARLGQNLLESAEGYKTMAAAAMGTQLAGRGAHDVFVAVSEASAALGLSADQSRGAMIALGQMLSKGTVQAEELRGQLGERIPGAFQIASRAMGVTTSELGKMLQEGEVLATDFLPKFAAELHKTFGADAEGAAKTFQGAANQMETAWLEMKNALAETSWMKAVKEGIQDLARGTAAAAEMIKESRTDMMANISAGFGGWEGPGNAPVRYTGDEFRKLEAGTSLSTIEEEGKQARVLAEARKQIQEQQKKAAKDREDFNKFLAGLATKEERAAQGRARLDAAVATGEVTPEFAAQMKQRLDEKAAGKGAGAGPSAVSFEDMNQQLDKYADKVAKMYESLSASSYDFWIGQAKDSGDFYRAEELHISQWAEKSRAEVDKQVIEAERAARELQEKLSGAKGGGTAAAWQAVQAAEARLAEVRKLAAQQYQVLAQEEQRRYQGLTKIELEQAQSVAQLNKEYAEIVGTTKDRTEAALKLLEVEWALKKVNASPEQQAAIDRLYTAKYQQAYQQQYGTAMEGFTDAWNKWEPPTAFQRGQKIFEAMTHAIDSAADALAEFTLTGKMNFTDFANSILRDMLRMQYQQMLMQLMGGGSSGGGLFGLFSGLFGGAAGGATANAGASGWSNASMGAGFGFTSPTAPPMAPRGSTPPMAPPMAPSVGRGGGGGPGGPNVHVSVKNESSNQVKSEMPSVNFDGEKWVIGIVLSDLHSGGSLAKAMRGLGARG